MSLLNDLANLFHHHSQQPMQASQLQVQQAHNTPHYEDGSGPGIPLAPQQSPANLGVPYAMNPSGVQLPQGSQYNPGLTPLQGSQGAGTNPQVMTGNPFQPQYNPQDNSRQQHWLP